MTTSSSPAMQLPTGGGATATHGGYTVSQVRGLLAEHLQRQTAMCNALETFCDGLPDNVTAGQCLALSQSVFPTVHRAHQFEENVLFALLRSLTPDPSVLERTLDRLHGEHWEDESYAEEIAQALRDFAPERDSRSAETLAYMVRGFFEGLRRHVAFESEHILPMLDGIEAH